MSTADNSQPTPAPTPADNSQAVPAPLPVAAAPAPTADGTIPGPSSSPPVPQPNEANGGSKEGWDMEREKLDFEHYNRIMDGLRTLPKQALQDDTFTGTPGTPPGPSPSGAAPVPGLPTPPDPGAPVPAPAPDPLAPKPPGESDDDDDDEPLPPGTLPVPGQSQHKQIKFRPQNAVDESALRIAKATGQSVTSLEVINAARSVNGLPPIGTPAAAPAPGAPPAPADPNAPPAAPTTVADTEARIAELKAQRRTAKENFDFAAEESIESQIEGLQDLRQTLRSQEASQAQQSQATEQQTFHTEWQRNSDLAVTRYPQIKETNSPLLKRAHELQAAAQLRNDPLYGDPRSAYLYVRDAADELGIPPVLGSTAPPPAPAPAPAPAPVPQPSLSTSQPSGHPPLSAMISGGNSSSPSPPPATTDEALIDAATSSPEAYQRFMSAQRGIRYGAPSPP